MRSKRFEASREVHPSESTRWTLSPSRFFFAASSANASASRRWSLDFFARRRTASAMTPFPEQ